MSILKDEGPLYDGPIAETAESSQLEKPILESESEKLDDEILDAATEIKQNLPLTGEQCMRSKDEADKKCNGWGTKNTKNREDDTYALSNDICRICHMEGFPSIRGNRSIRESENRDGPRIESQVSNHSCYAYLGPLISACKCRGTVGLVHAECLERWLTESGHTRCELCGFKYSTKRVPRYNVFQSIYLWFKSVIATRQMILDFLYLAVMTPLALFSCYICVLACKIVLAKGLYDVPWLVIAMLPTCMLTLIAYWGWVITLVRLHGRRWRRYWRTNFVVRLIPDNIDVILTREDTTERPEIIRIDTNDVLEPRGNNRFEELLQIF